jgi:hypothetical protein
MSWHPRDLGQQAGRTFVVTGANSGIGFETSRALVARGAHLVLAVRDTNKGEKAASQLGGPGSTSVVELDLADLDQIAGSAKRILDAHSNLSGLICNAGVMGGPLLRSAQGFELQMATNHLGHAALVSALWPVLRASASRVVLLTSNEAKRGQLSPTMTRDDLLNPDAYDGKQVYRNTKQATFCSLRNFIADARIPMRPSAWWRCILAPSPPTCSRDSSNVLDGARWAPSVHSSRKRFSRRQLQGREARCALWATPRRAGRS